MDKIISKSNEKAKFIRSLNEKKYRHETNSFYLEGIKVVQEIINSVYSNKAIDILFIAYSEDILKNQKDCTEILNEIIDFSTNNNIELLHMSEDVFKSVSDTINPQGLLVVIKNEVQKFDLKLCAGNNILMLDRIQDAGNMGTILRTALAFDIKTVLYTKGTVDIYSRKSATFYYGEYFKFRCSRSRRCGYYYKSTKKRRIYGNSNFARYKKNNKGY